MRFLATFTPQAWQRDYAIDVDPEGPTEWDCTAFIRDPANGLKESEILEVIQSDGSWLDTDDVLKGDDAAPAWVKEWQGPFSINVTTAVASEYEGGVCPDCGDDIPAGAVKGGACDNCGHVWN